MHGLYFPYPGIVKTPDPKSKSPDFPQLCFLRSVAFATNKINTNMSSPSPDNGIFVRETNVPAEKTTAAQVTQDPDECYYNIYDEGHGDIQVFTVADAADVKLARDGKTVLIPQPSDDPDDVLNWTTGKKYRVLSSLIFASMV